MRRFLWSAHPLRAVAEALVIEIVLLLGLMASIPEQSLVVFAFPWLADVPMIICGLRARLPEGRLLAVVSREIGLTALTSITMYALFGLLTRSESLPVALALLVMPPLVFFPL